MALLTAGIVLVELEGADTAVLVVFLLFAFVSAPLVSFALYKVLMFIYRHSSPPNALKSDHLFFLEQLQLEFICSTSLALDLVCWAFIFANGAASPAVYMYTAQALGSLLVSSILIGLAASWFTLWATSVNSRTLGAKARILLRRERLLCMCLEADEPLVPERAQVFEDVGKLLNTETLQTMQKLIDFIVDNPMHFRLRGSMALVNSTAKARLAAGMLCDVLTDESNKAMKEEGLHKRLEYLNLMHNRHRFDIKLQREVHGGSVLIHRAALEKRFSLTTASDGDALWDLVAVDGKVTVSGLFKAFQNHVTERDQIRHQVREMASVVRQVHFAAVLTAGVWSLILVLYIFNTNLQSVWVVFSSFVLSFSFIFGATLQQAFANIVYLLQNDYLVGDTILINDPVRKKDPSFTVKSIGVFSAVLTKEDGSRLLAWHQNLIQATFFNERDRENISDEKIERDGYGRQLGRSSLPSELPVYYILP